MKMKNFLILSLAALLPSMAQAQEFDTKAKQAYMVEAKSGTVMYAKDADSRMVPSSMTKVMTVYLLFEKLKEGSLKLDDQFMISEAAWRMGGSKMFVHVGDSVKVEDLMRGIIVQSGNDACVAVAEGLAGSEENFAKMMNEKAAQLGLTGSHFMNSNGWPAPNHYMTAKDLVTLSQRMITDFPEYYHYWAEREYTYNNIKQPNRNRLLGEMGVDGLKTGHTEDGGYGITISANQPDGRHIVFVVNGLTSEGERHEEAKKLLQYGINNFEVKTIAQPGMVVTKAKTWFAAQPSVALTVDKPIVMVLPRFDAGKQVALKAKLLEPIPAPLSKGTKVGELQVSVADGATQTYPLFTAEAVEQMPVGDRFFPSLTYRLFGK